MTMRILFVAEAVTLAHVARPVVLADSLEPAGLDIHFASSGQFSFCHDGKQWGRHTIDSLAPATFLDRLRLGKPVYTSAELGRYVADDLRLIAGIKPDAIVGDFRLSLAVSARKAGVPLLVVCNGHWSPFASHAPIAAPDLALGNLLGYRVFDPLFRVVWPLASRVHTIPANRVRKVYGMSGYRTLSEMYCDGDYVMYADIPELTPLRQVPLNHAFIGPVVWNPEMPLPPWWQEIHAAEHPPVYVSLGSTGHVDLLPQIVEICRRDRVCCIVTTAGRSDLQTSPPWTYVHPYLPGSSAAAISSMVICNGGSATAYQALAQGRPVLGICSNLDQVLTMQGIAKAGAGAFLRAGEANPERLRYTIQQLRQEKSFTTNAKRLQAGFRAFDPCQRFPALVQEIGEPHKQLQSVWRNQTHRAP